MIVGEHPEENTMEQPPLTGRSEEGLKQPIERTGEGYISALPANELEKLIIELVDLCEYWKSAVQAGKGTRGLEKGIISQSKEIVEYTRIRRPRAAKTTAPDTIAPLAEKIAKTGGGDGKKVPAKNKSPLPRPRQASIDE